MNRLLKKDFDDHRKGLTLIEFIIVITFIGIVAAIVVVVIQNKRWPEPSLTLTNLEQQSPDGGQAVAYEKIQQLISAGKYEEAIQACNTVLKRDQRDVNAWNMKGIALVSTKKFGDALNCFNWALKIAPEAAGLWVNKGMALASLEQYEEALSSYNQAIALDPTEAIAWNGKGHVLLALEKYPECTQNFRKLTQLQPQNQIAWYSKGVCLMNAKPHLALRPTTNEYKEMLDAFQKVTQLASANDESDAATFIQILSFKGNMTAQDRNGNTAFMLAVETGQMPIVKALLKQGADVDVSNHDGQTPLHLAARQRSVELVKLLLERHAHVADTDNDGWDALMYAASNGGAEIVKLLVERGAEVNQTGYTPLMAAARRGHVEVVKLLLQSGADQQAQITREGSEYKGWTALKFAEAGNHTEVAQILTEFTQTPQNQYSETSTQPGQPYDIEKDIGEQLVKKFFTQEFVVLWGVLKEDGVPEKTIETLMNSEKFIEPVSVESVTLLELWGPDMVNIPSEKMPADMRQALESFRGTIRAEAQEQLSEIIGHDQQKVQTVSPTQSLTTVEQLASKAEEISPEHFWEGFIEAMQAYNAVRLQEYLSNNPNPTTDVQKWLIDLGYNPGPVDGKMGPMTTKAIKSFQQAYGLAVTGKLDEETIQKLAIAESALQKSFSYGIDRGIEEELLKKFVTAEFTSLWMFLRDDGFPEEKIKEIMMREEVINLSAIELLQLLAEWGTDMAKLSLEEMPDNMRQALESCRNTIRVEAQKRLATKSTPEPLTIGEQLTVATPVETPQPTPVTSQLSLVQENKKNIMVITKEISLGKIQHGIMMESLVASPDDRRVTYVVKQDGKMFVMVDGKEGKSYDNLAIPVFSPDSQRVAYGAIHDNKEIVVVDGQEGRPYDRIMEGPIFSPDGQRVAYVAQRGDKKVIVVDGQEGTAHDGIGENSLKFSPDSQRVAYVATRDDKMLIVMNGQEGKPYDGIGESALIFSPDSQRVAYMAFRDDKQVVVVDDQEGKAYDGIDNLIFSSDSQRVAYVGMYIGIHDNKQVAVVDGQEGDAYEGILAGSLIFSPDSQRVAYVAGQGSKQVAVVDGQEGTAYDGIGENSLKFSPDSQRVVYVAIRDDKMLIVMDGQEGKSYDGIGGNSPIFSPDSRRVTYVAAWGGKKFVVVDDQEGKSYDEIFEGPMFSPDSQWVAYIAGQGDKKFVVVGEQEGQTYDAIRNNSLVFSPDSQRVAYLAKQEDKRVIVVDGQEGKSYSNFITNLQFDGPTSFHLLGFQGIEVVRVEGEIVATESDTNVPIITPTPMTSDRSKSRYNISRDIGEELFKNFVMTELASLMSVFLNEGTYPGEKVRDLMSSKDLAPVFVGEARKLLEEWGPDMARLSPEQMPENMRKALESFRKTMREDAEKRLADLNAIKKYDLQNDIGQELASQFIEREFIFLDRSLKARGFPKEKIDELLMSKEFIAAFTAVELGLLEIWGPDIVKLPLEQMPENMRNALEKSREQIRAEGELADKK